MSKYLEFEVENRPRHIISLFLPTSNKHKIFLLVQHNKRFINIDECGVDNEEEKCIRNAIKTFSLGTLLALEQFRRRVSNDDTFISRDTFGRFGSA